MATKALRRPNGKQSIVIVDDHPVVRAGLAMVINQQPDLTVAGLVQSAEEALKEVPGLKPDLVLVDLALEDRSGLELIKSLRAQDSKVRLLVLSMHDEMLYAERALRAGASGYVMKHEGMDSLLAAIRRVLRGEVHLSAQLKEKIFGAQVGRTLPVPNRSPMQLLSDRELEVFELIGEGLGTREIAKQLCLSMKTVSCYRENIKTKLRLRDGIELMRQAIFWGAPIKKVGATKPTAV